MIVTCERCTTQFQLDDARVPPTGARVRCSRCKHAFEVQPPQPPGATPQDAVHQAAQRALEAESSLPDTTQDLPIDSQVASVRSEDSLPPGSPPSALSAEDDDEESDWEFNHDLPASGSEEAPPAAESADAARSLVDDLLAQPPLGEPGTPEEETGAADACFENSDLESDFEDLGGLDLGLEAPASEPVEPVGDGGPEASVAPEPSPLAPSALSTDAAPRDELGSPDEWDFFASEIQGPAEERRGSLASPSPACSEADQRVQTPTEVVESDPSHPTHAWLGRATAGAGWAAAVAALCAALYAAAVPGASPTRTSQSLPGLVVNEVSSRWVPNAVAGPLFVVSGRIDRQGASPRAGRLGVALLDRDGRELSTRPALLGPPLDPVGLRELDPDTLVLAQQSDPLGIEASLAARSGVRFEALVVDLPPEATAFQFRTFEARPEGPNREADPRRVDRHSGDPAQRDRG